MKLIHTRFLVLIAVAALLVSIPAVVFSAVGYPRHTRFAGNAFLDGSDSS